MELKEELGRGGEKSKEKETINPQDNLVPSHNTAALSTLSASRNTARISPDLLPSQITAAFLPRQHSGLAPVPSSTLTPLKLVLSAKLSVTGSVSPTTHSSPALTYDTQRVRPRQRLTTDSCVQETRSEELQRGHGSAPFCCCC